MFFFCLTTLFTYLTLFLVTFRISFLPFTVNLHRLFLKFILFLHLFPTSSTLSSSCLIDAVPWLPDCFIIPSAVNKLQNTVHITKMLGTNDKISSCDDLKKKKKKRNCYEHKYKTSQIVEIMHPTNTKQR